MEELFTKRAQAVLEIVQEEAKRLKHRSVSSEHVLLALVAEQSGVAGKVLREMDLNETGICEETEHLIGYGGICSYPKGVFLPYSPRMKQAFALASSEVKKAGSQKVGTERILMSLLKDKSTITTRIMVNLGISLPKARRVLKQKMGLAGDSDGKEMNRHRNIQDKWQTPQGTPVLDLLARDLTKLVEENKLDPVVGRSREAKRLIQVLSRRTKNNLVLVGELGVGKIVTAEGSAQKIILSEVPEDMREKRLMMLDMGSLVAGTKYRGEFGDRMKKVIDEIYNDGQVILFINELHTLIGAGGTEGAVDASNISKPASARGELQAIGATTLDEYQKYIEKDSALERRFAQIQVDEPTPEEAEKILQGLRSRYEEHHRVEITNEAVRTAVNLPVRYIASRQLLDKTIDSVDESVAKARSDQTDHLTKSTVVKLEIDELVQEKEAATQKQDFENAARLRRQEKALRKKLQKVSAVEAKQEQGYSDCVTEEDVATVASEWAGVPLQQLEKKGSERLLELEGLLHERMVGQDEAIKAVSRAIRRTRSGLKGLDRPIGSFMFLGPTGVGKTELAKALSEVMFGGEDILIRVDMLGFMKKYNTNRLIGSPPEYVGYDEGGQLTEKIRQKPYSVILLGKVEKAHPDVFNSLLQVLDDGHLTDSRGRKVDFRNTIMIMTSNIGATQVRGEKSVGFNVQDVTKDHRAMQKRILEELKKAFRPEFLNRINEIVVFHSLSEDEIRTIVQIMSKAITKRLKEQDIQVKITPFAISVIGKAGFDPEYGVRPVRRVLQKEIEDRLSEALLGGEIRLGDHVTVGAPKGKITLGVRGPKKGAVGSL